MEYPRLIKLYLQFSSPRQPRLVQAGGKSCDAMTGAAYRVLLARMRIIPYICIIKPRFKMNEHDYRLKRWLAVIPAGLPTVIVTAAILWLTLAPHPLPDNDMPMIPGLDKVVHACMFGGLYFIAALDLAIGRTRRKKAVFPLLKRTTALCLALSVAAFGGIIELAQGAMGLGRGCDPADFVADAAGVALAVWLTPRVVRLLCCRG